MSDKMRWRCGDTNYIVAAVDADTEIRIGDQLWLDGDDAKPASMAVAADDPDQEPDTLRAFVKRFLGVAMQRSMKGDAAPIKVATTGVFEFDCPADTFELGDMVGADVNDEETALVNQRVSPVASADHAIGRVHKREAAPTTSVYIDISSRVLGKLSG